MSLSYDLGRCRCIHRCIRIPVNVSACRERERQQPKAERKTRGRGGGEYCHFVVERCHVMCYGKALLTFKFYNARMSSAAANICIRTFAEHPKNAKRSLFVIKPRVLYLHLGTDSEGWKFTAGLSRIYMRVFSPRPSSGEFYSRRYFSRADPTAGQPSRYL